MKTIVRQTLIAVSCASVLLVGGCKTMSKQQRDVLIGAGVGAIAGAVASDNKGKGAAIGAGIGALGGYIWSKKMEEKRQAMEKATAGTGIVVAQTADNQLKVNVPSDLSFALNSYTINPQLRPVLDQFANGLQNQATMDINVVGHTDNTGTAKINQPLSLNRANSVREYLLARGVNAGRIGVNGVADSQPMAANDSDSNRSKNRRVEIFLGERAVAPTVTQ